MKEVLQALLKVKSIITILLTIAFVGLLAFGQSIPQEFTMIYTTVISFYFGTQAGKAVNETSNKG